MDMLVASAILTWPTWVNPALRAPTRDWRTGETPPAVDRATWCYSVDFSQLPALRVTRWLDGNGSLPPWPTIAGFTAPAENRQATGTYQPSDPPSVGDPLSFTFANLPATAAQSAHVSASITRNANLVPPGMPAGTTVDEAFIYRTPNVMAKDPVLPLLDLPSRRFPIGVNAPNLSAAIDDLLAPFVAQPTLAGLTVREIRLAIAGAYWFTLAQGGKDQSIPSGNPIFLTQEVVALSPSSADATISIAKFRQNLVDALVSWRCAMQPSEAGASIRLSVTLYTIITDEFVPLVRLGEIEIAVPADQPGWWS